jgi:hypothetical protein
MTPAEWWLFYDAKVAPNVRGANFTEEEAERLYRMIK